MLSSRVRAVALTGVAAFLPLLSTAQESRLPRVDVFTPLSQVTEYARTARLREVGQAMRSAFYATMGAHVTLPKRTSFKADYYDAWRARIHDRAFPGETISPDLYTRAVERRLQMAPAPPIVVGTASTGTASVKTTGSRAAFAAPVGGTFAPVSSKWEPVGPTRTRVPYEIYYGPANSIVSGRVGGIAFDPIDSNIVYMTGSAGGVFKTTNGGLNWTPLASGILSSYMGPIAVSPTNRNLIITGAGDFDGGAGVGDGFYRSTDGGATWTSIARTQITNVAFSDIVFDKSTPGRILATAGRRGATNGLWASADNGLTWTKRFVSEPVAPENLSLGSISVGPNGANGDKPMVAAREYPAGVYYSRDAGRTWREVTNYPGAGANARNVAVASPTDPNVMYAAEDGNQRVYKGVRSPATNTWTWTNITTNLPNDGYNWSQSSYDMHIHAASHTVNGVKRDTVYVGLITIAAWNGTTWSDIGATYGGSGFNSSLVRSHNDQHTFAVFPGDSTKMAVGNDGGIYGLTISPTGTHTFNARMNGDATMAMFYSGAWHPTDPNRILGGTQDNASPVAVGDLGNWRNVTGGDGTGTAIDPLNPGFQYGAAQFLSVYGTPNGWMNQVFLRGDWTDPAGVPFVGRMATDNSPEGYLYTGGNSRLFRFGRTTGVWTDYIGAQTFAAPIRSIAAAPSNPSVIYVGTERGQIYVTYDRGLTWRLLQAATTLGSITSFAIHPTRPWDVLVSTGATAAHVYRYPDTRVPPPGMPPPSLVSVSGGGALPNIFASSVARNQNKPDTDWYVSTDVGVFGTVNSGGTWFNMTEPLGLPAIEGSTIQHTPGTGYLNLATYGRGMWRIRIDAVTTPALMEVTATIRRSAYNVVVVTVRVKNVGPVDATLTKVVKADMSFPTAFFPAFTPLPMNLGTIAAGATKETTITYKDNYLTPGRRGVVGVELGWRSGTQNLGIVAPIDVILP